MTVIGDFAFPGEHFVLRETVPTPNVEIEIERLVAHVDEGLTPYFRVTADDFDPVEQALLDDPTLTDLTLLETVIDERFYRAHWTDGSEGLKTVLERTNGAVLSATYEGDHWEVRMLFGDRDRLSACFEHCERELDYDIGLVRVFDRSNPATYGEYGLTSGQRDALLAALERGYYEVPREGDLGDLAEDLSVTAQAVSERLRRGSRSLLQNTLGTHTSDDD